MIIKKKIFSLLYEVNQQNKNKKLPSTMKADYKTEADLMFS